MQQSNCVDALVALRAGSASEGCRGELPLFSCAVVERALLGGGQWRPSVQPLYCFNALAALRAASASQGCKQGCFPVLFVQMTDVLYWMESGQPGWEADNPGLLNRLTEYKNWRAGRGFFLDLLAARDVDIPDKVVEDYMFEPTMYASLTAQGKNIKKTKKKDKDQKPLPTADELTEISVMVDALVRRYRAALPDAGATWQTTLLQDGTQGE